MKKTNLHSLPDMPADKLLAALEAIRRGMPQQAAMAKIMQEEFKAAGFAADEALKLVAYSMFK